jgi:phosphate transport system protein
MERHLDRELDKVRENIIKMATLAEESVGKACKAFTKHDTSLAESVIKQDSEINAMEMTVDREIFEFLALRQPVAADLRFLFSVQKMNKDLERIGDHAVNIAQSAISFTSTKNETPEIKQVELMISITKQMLSEAITSIVNNDSQLALKVLEQDDQVDDLNSAVTRDMIDLVKKDSASIEAALDVIRISKNLERVADLSTNIAEDVIFNTKALDVKHLKPEQFK